MSKINDLQVRQSDLASAAIARFSELSPGPRSDRFSVTGLAKGVFAYLWRAVDHEGEVLEAVVTARRDKAAALKLLKRIMKKYGLPQSIVTDRLRAYSAAMKEISAAAIPVDMG